MSTADKILKEIKDKDVKYVDVRFTDTKGKLQHVTFDIDLVDEDFLNEGTMFDGSSIAGWKAINESDMLLKPDLTTAYIDPFYQATTMFLFCDVMNPDTGEPYNRDSRSMAKKALAVHPVLGRGRRGLFRPGSRVLHLRRRALDDRAGPHRAIRMTRSNCRPTRVRNTPKATWATALDPRAAISPSTRSTRARTCAPRCWA
jgi:hypothetical protein